MLLNEKVDDWTKESGKSSIESSDANQNRFRHLNSALQVTYGTFAFAAVGQRQFLKTSHIDPTIPTKEARIELDNGQDGYAQGVSPRSLCPALPLPSSTTLAILCLSIIEHRDETRIADGPLNLAGFSTRKIKSHTINAFIRGTMAYGNGGRYIEAPITLPSLIEPLIRRRST